MFSIEEFEKNFNATRATIAQGHEDFNAEFTATTERIAKKRAQLRIANAEFDIEHAVVSARIAQSRADMKVAHAEFEQSRIRTQTVVNGPIVRNVTAKPMRRSSNNSDVHQAHQQHLEQSRLFHEQMQRDQQQLQMQMHMNMHHGF